MPAHEKFYLDFLEGWKEWSVDRENNTTKKNQKRNHKSFFGVCRGDVRWRARKSLCPFIMSVHFFSQKNLKHANNDKERSHCNLQQNESLSVSNLHL